MEAHSSLAGGPLARYIGSWQGEVSVEVLGSASRRYTQHNRFAWALGGCFMEERGRGSDGSSFYGLWLFDPGTRLYAGHYFAAPAGNAVVLRHEWNEATLTFEGTAELGGGLRMRARDVFLGPDSYEWSFAIEDASGQVVQRMQALERRVEPERRHDGR